MKILFVNQTFYPDAVSTAQHLTDLAFALKNDGHEVTVLTSRRGYSSPHPSYPSSEVYKDVHIIRVWPFMLGRQNQLMRAIDALGVNLSFFARMLFLPRADTVIALTSPPLVSFFACLAARFKRSRLVYWVMDMNPDEAIAMGWIREASWVAELLKKCQAFVVKQSDRVIVLDGYMKTRLMMSLLGACSSSRRDVWPYVPTKYHNPRRGLEAERVVVVPPWSHDEDLQVVRHEDNPFRTKYGLQNKFVVMYSGNHSVCHPLDTVLAAAHLLKEDDSIVFMFIGGGTRVRDVSEFKRKHGLNNIVQLDYIVRSEIRFSLSAADLHLVVMGDNMAGIVHPCKVYGILALGRPFVYVGPVESHVVDLIAEGAVGYAVRHGAAEKLVQIILHSQKKSPAELDAIRAKNRAVAKRFSAKALIPSVANIILMEDIKTSGK